MLVILGAHKPWKKAQNWTMDLHKSIKLLRPINQFVEYLNFFDEAP